MCFGARLVTKPIQNSPTSADNIWYPAKIPYIHPNDKADFNHQKCIGIWSHECYNLIFGNSIYKREDHGLVVSMLFANQPVTEDQGRVPKPNISRLAVILFVCTSVRFDGWYTFVSIVEIVFV